MVQRTMIVAVCLMTWFMFSTAAMPLWADPPEETAPAPSEPAPAAEKAPADDAADEEAPSGLTRVAKDYDVWIDRKRKLVVVDGKVVLREGALEMFACSRGTKEHESVVAVNSPARFIHAALLAVGAKPGSPVRFHPEYVAASGPVVDVWVLWKDAEGNKRQARAQEWIKKDQTDEVMPYPFVFAGSSFWRDEDSGETYYQADAGDLICVSNFTTAMLDIPVESSQANTGLLFSANTEKIPPRDTPVRLVLIPRMDAGKSEKPAEEPGDEPSESKDEGGEK